MADAAPDESRFGSCSRAVSVHLPFEVFFSV